VEEDSVVTLTEVIDEEAKQAILGMSEEAFYKAVKTGKDFKLMQQELIDQKQVTLYRYMPKVRRTEECLRLGSSACVVPSAGW